MSRQVDKSVAVGLLLGLTFTFGVVFLFERGIPQRLLRSMPAWPGGLLGRLFPGSAAPGLPTTDHGQDAGFSAVGAQRLSAAALGTGATNQPGSTVSAVEAPKQSDTEVVAEPAGPWPLWALHTPKPGTELQLPPGSHVVSLDLDPRGEQVAVVLVAARGERSLHLWHFDQELPSLLRRESDQPGSPRTPTSEGVTEVAWSRFGHGLFVILQAGSEWRIERLSQAARVGAPALGQRQVVYRSRSRLSHLVASGVLYGGEERIFFAREHVKDQWQILTILGQGGRVYEVTSPSGGLGPLTDPSLRKPPAGSGVQTPRVLRVRSAKPISVSPASGRLLFVDGSRAVHSLPYSHSNWASQSDKLPVPPGTLLRDTPNGALLLRQLPAAKGADLVDSAAQKPALQTLGADLRFVLLPIAAPTGRSVLAAVQRADREVLSVFPVTERAAFVRYLDQLGTGRFADPELPAQVRSQLRQRGLWLAATADDQLYGVYKNLEPGTCSERTDAPIFASIDGFLEVMAAGFQATFMATEQLVSIPRMRRFLREIERVAAGQTVLSRIGKIATVSLAVLKGDYSDPEAKLILAQKPARSSLHTFPSAAEIDFSRAQPRGPYTATDGLQHYFRALLYLSELRASPDELRLLDGDAALRLAWRAWIETQSSLLFETRLPLLFEPDRPLPAYVQKDCVPPDVRRHPRLFPLAFGIDSEIWNGVVAHDGLSDSCQVPGRPLPSGLDLLTALGSDEAQAIQSSDYAQLPALRDAHDRLRRRFAGPLATDRVAESWLRLVQLLATDRLVPEGIDPTLWRRRLLQTALASWTNYRHTTVQLAPGTTATAACTPRLSGFEILSREPARGVVDPLPEGWEQVARTLGMLADHSGKLLPDQPELGILMRQSADRARAFGHMAARQLRGVPLRPSEYQQIQRFSESIEPAYVKLKALIAPTVDTAHSQPESMQKIVDVAHVGSSYFHVAVGRPLQLIGLFADRGLLVPASGAVYSSHELVAEQPLDDLAWRERSDPARPWTPQALTAAGALAPATEANPASPH